VRRSSWPTVGAIRTRTRACGESVTPEDRQVIYDWRSFQGDAANLTR
jgi:hypothetical protein